MDAIFVSGVSMLKLVHVANSLPLSYPVDPTAEFQPGMIAQLKVMGNEIVAGVSDGTAPFGIIDDVRTNAFTKPQIDEVIEIAGIDDSFIETNGNGDRVSTKDEYGFLEFPNLVENSFTSTVSVTLNAVNGVITIPAGTVLNYDSDGDGIYDGFRTVVNYIYRVPNKPGDDSTIGSGRITIHYQRGIYATDQFEIGDIYAVNSNIYVSLAGKFSTRQVSATHPGVGFVTGIPGATNTTLELMLL